MNFDCHWRAAVVSGVSLAVGGALGKPSAPEELIPYFSGVVFGAFFSPDLDIDSGMKWMRRGVGKLFRLILYPYAKLIPHRSPLSHAPIISTLLRLAFLFPFPLIVYKIGGIQALLMFILGAVVSDVSHFILDIL